MATIGDLQEALGDGTVDKDPTSGLANPRFKLVKQKKIIDKSDIPKAEWSLELRERLIFLLALVQALRPGEITGLKCGDVKPDGLHIERRFYRRIVDLPKSTNSSRTVPLAAPVARVLEEYMGLLSGKAPDAWLFPSENPANPIDYTNVFRRRIQPALSRVGLGWVNFQAMRRTAANLLKEVENDPRVRSDIMGQSVNVHENEYRQSSQQRKEKTMRDMGDVLQ